MSKFEIVVLMVLALAAIRVAFVYIMDDELAPLSGGLLAVGAVFLIVYFGVPHFFVSYLEKEESPNHTLELYCLDEDQSASHVWYVLFARQNDSNTCSIGHGDNPQNSIRNYILWGTFLGTPALIVAVGAVGVLIAEEGIAGLGWLALGIAVLAIAALALLIYLMFWAFIIMIGIFAAAAATSRK